MSPCRPATRAVTRSGKWAVCLSCAKTFTQPGREVGFADVPTGDPPPAAPEYNMAFHGGGC